VGGVEPDLAILLTGAARVVADRLGAAVEAAGIDDMRTPYGFVIRALADRDRTLTELAELLSVTKQAAIKVVDEMEQRGFLTRRPDPGDRRVKLLSLTDKGRRVRAAALAASRALEQELAEDVGRAGTAAARRALLALLERHGGLEHARAGRSRALW
jgi:DNA-binding MarR family transcriptional regulator